MLPVRCVNGKGDDVCFVLGIGAEVKSQAAWSAGGQVAVRIDDQKQLYSRETGIVRNESLAHGL